MRGCPPGGACDPRVKPEMAPKRRRNDPQACEVRYAKGPMWFQGRVVGTTEEAVAVRTSTGVVYDVARASERLCRIGTHGARGRTPARPVST